MWCPVLSSQRPIEFGDYGENWGLHHVSANRIHFGMCSRHLKYVFQRTVVHPDDVRSLSFHFPSDNLVNRYARKY